MGVRDGAIVYFDGVLKLLGVSHGMLGGLLVILGVVVRLVVDHWTSVMLLALWIGVIIAATGAIAVSDSNMDNTDNSRKYYLVDFLLFSVISLILSTILIVCYCMAVHTAFTGEEVGSFGWYSYDNYHKQNMLRTKIFTVVVLILGLLEFLLCVGSIGYVAYSYKRDHGTKSSTSSDDDDYSYPSFPDQNRKPPRTDNAPYSFVNETYT
ncbi:hypothetical protein ACROYT_G031217 [Oculina patagonica]